MITFLETVATLGGAAVLLRVFGPGPSWRQTSPKKTKKKKQGLHAGRDMEHVNQAGRDIHFHPPQEPKGDLMAYATLKDLQRTVDYLMVQNTRLMDRVEHLTEENMGLWNELLTKTDEQHKYIRPLLDVKVA